MDKNKRIYVAGHRGLVGSAICRRLGAEGYDNLLTRSSTELDLRDMAAVRAFFEAEKPDYVFLAAAKVGGIHANNIYPADFIAVNLMIQNAVIDAAHHTGVDKLMILGSSCIYPKLAPQPIPEDALLSGPLEPTNEWYAVAKIAGIKMGQAYRKQYGLNAISAMPTNLYGPGDNFDLQTSHVLPALIRKFHEAHRSGAADVEIWGSGTPKREFLHVDDLADALFMLMQTYDEEGHINVGYGEDVSIKELAETVGRVVGFEGGLRFDTSKPDGPPRKLVDSGKLFSLGWRPKISLEEGIKQTYDWYLENSD